MASLSASGFEYPTVRLATLLPQSPSTPGSQSGSGTTGVYASKMLFMVKADRKFKFEREKVVKVEAVILDGPEGQGKEGVVAFWNIDKRPQLKLDLQAMLDSGK